MICRVMLLAASILGLGDSPSSGGQTLALALTFLGIGIIANLLIAYAVLQAWGERKQNQERMRRLRERQ
jgi:HD-like signal output (HDOD) protein